jgi:flavin-dependent dehydrogenase
MSSAHDLDAIVIGGGPAGSTAATLMARDGARVLLLEREQFPREHVGESLLPASLPILEALGVREAVEAAGFLKKYGATMVWGTSPDPWSWYFQETNDRYPHAYQVVRAQFDQILLDNAAASGVDVRQRARVVELLRDGAAVSGVAFEGPDGRDEARARIVIDASGQGAVIANALGLREWDEAFRNLAVYGYYRDAARLPSPDENNILVEAHADGWCWTIPLHDGRTSVGVVVDSERARERIEGGDLRAFLAEHVAQAPHTAALVGGAALEGEPRAVRDWSYVAGALIGDGYVLAGDAACFIDPLFSSGVHLAMNAGVLAAAYVATLRRDELLAREARPVYERLYLQQYQHFRELARLFYSSNRTADSYFWEARRLRPEDAGLDAREAFVNAVAGQPPQGYERVVLDRGDAPEAFVAAVRETETRRSARSGEAESLRATLPAAVPRIASGVRLLIEPVLDDGQFVRAHVVRSPSRPAGTPVSPLVAASLQLMDGRRSVTAIAEALSREHQIEVARLQPAVEMATEILFVDGAIEGLGEGG